MIQHIKEWGIAHLGVIGGLAYAAWPQLREYICSHPVVSGSGLALTLVLALLKQSPLNAPQAKPNN